MGMIGAQVEAEGRIGTVIAWQPQFRRDDDTDEIATPIEDRFLLVVQFPIGRHGQRECHFRPASVTRVDGQPVDDVPTRAEMITGALRRDG